MTLFDATPPKPPRKIGRYVVIAVALLMIGGVAYIALRNQPEEQAVSRFVTVLEQSDYRQAYQLWQPSSSYSYEDFLHDWGEHGDFGKVHSFKILGSRSKGAPSTSCTLPLTKLSMRIFGPARSASTPM